LEGVCFDTSKNNIYVLNEKSPKQLLKLNSKGEIKDDEKRNNFWVISDESKAIYQISKKGILQKKHKTGIKKGEGIAIYKNRLYVVSDNLKTLYVFEIAN